MKRNSVAGCGLYCSLLLSCLLLSIGVVLPAADAGGSFEAVAVKHCYGGVPRMAIEPLPSGENAAAVGVSLVSNGYAVYFDYRRNCPAWVAYRIEADYLKTPKREGPLATFRVDQGVRSSDYTHSGYQRGHLAPWAVMGGDRDGDGEYADTDPDDAETIKQANLMSNISPQSGAFNAGGGAWWLLEREVQESVKPGCTVWVYAGCVFGRLPFDEIADGKIEVPVAFWKVVVQEGEQGNPTVRCYLFPHHREKRESVDLDAYRVSVDHIEALAGLDLFPDIEIDETAECGH